MDINFFILTLAWIACICSGVLVALRVTYWTWYHFTTNGQAEKLIDNIRGREASFPVMIPGIIFVVSVIAILSF